MAKQKQEIEEAVVVEESTSILSREFKAPVLPKLINKDQSIATIKQSLKTYEDIEIKDTKDKVNYDIVSKGMAKMKSDRIAWKKAVVENLQDPVAQWLADTKLDISEIENTFKDGETLLRAKKELIDTKKREEKEEAEAAKVKLLTERIEVIIGLGGKNAGSQYVFDYDLTLFVTIAQMKDLEEKKWLPVLKEIQDTYTAEQTRIADAKKADEELAEANNTKEKELKEKQRKLRVKELTLLGFIPTTPDNDVFEDKDGNQVGIAAIHEFEEDEWDEMIVKLQSEDEEHNSFDVASIDDFPETESSEELPFESATEEASLTADTSEELSFETTESAARQEYVDRTGFKEVVLEFDFSEPYLEFPMGEGFIQRIFHTDFADYAFELTPNQTTVLEGEINHQLQFVLIKVK